ncbi:amino acid transporter [Phyllobacterium brassicacearum]|uniref:Amino acid transporter n=1 Tax=Phyllobacterium brassicacearum TaxID=314235 RepID=A0A2P7BWZ2_9HYPH|nr:amino acid transporter [Phyllobacterium brassicacearum]
MTTVYNEQKKLTATWLNGLSVASYAVGGLAPLASSIYNASGPSVLIALGTVICIMFATALHLHARRTLKGLKP